MKLAFEIGKELKLDEGVKTIDSIFPAYVPGGTANFFKFFWPIIKNIYVLVSVILFIMIIVGGVGMIANAGNAEKQKQSSQTLTSAVLGFAIMFAAYWIVKIIELISGKRIFLF